MFSDNMSEATHTFFVEAKGTLEELNQSLLSYEGDTADLGLLDNLFKHVHALNGNASYLGHDQLIKLTEAFKDVISVLRKTSAVLNQEQLNIFFKAADLMNVLVEQVEKKQLQTIDLSDTISDLDTLKQAFSSASEETQASEETNLPSSTSPIATDMPQQKESAQASGSTTPEEVPAPDKQETPSQANTQQSTIEERFIPSDFMIKEANKQLVDPDMSIVVEACLLDAQELLEDLEELLNDLAATQERSPIYENIIKGLKSIRSSSGFLSLEQVATLSKHIQQLLEALLSDRLSWIDDFQDLLYAAFGRLRELLIQVQNGKLVPVDYATLINTLIKASQGSFSPELIDALPKYEGSLRLELASKDDEASSEEEETDHQDVSFYVGPDHPLYSDGMQEIVESFIVETGELFDDLDNKLLELEHHYKDEALVNDIFRAVHTIKGSAGFLSLDQLNQLTHHFEDVLNQLRRGGIEFHSDMMDIMFEAFDLMKVLQKQVIDMQLEVIDTKHIVKQLKLIAEGKFKGGTASKPRPPVKTSAPSSPEANKSKAAPKRTQDRSTETIRVEVERLDSLMNLVGELVLNRNRLVQIIDDVSHVLQEHDELYKTLLDTSSQLDFITTELQTGVMHTRMVQVGRIFNKFPRVVRDLAKDANKMINLVIEGAETELDKSLTEEIGDPLVHLIRNSVDHGVEPPDVRVSNGKEPQGSIRLSAQHEGNNIVIEIEDDGKGMDAEKLKNKAIEKGLITEKEAAEMDDKEAFNLIFKAGFSTAEKVTKISGRGVGMDVVKTNIAKMNGTISINSELGVGTVITLKLPLTLAINQSLLVRQGEETFAIPLHSVIEVVNLNEQKIDTVNGQEVIRIRERILPLVRIGEVLDIPNSKKSENAYAVIVGLAHHRIGLVADDLVGQKEIVIKPLGSYLKKVEGIAGSTILGDGHVIMILDVAQIIRSDKERQRAPAAELEMA